ncbi:MAG: hypothetical protein WC421_01570 [Elusimicrobiales bacterium]
MKTTTATTGRQAKYHVTVVSTVLDGTEFRCTIRRRIGVFGTIDGARAFAEAQARRPEVRNAKSRIRFIIRHNGKTVAQIKVQEAI